MKLASISFLLFAATALAADYKLTYSCYNKKGGPDGKGNNESKAAGTVDDSLAKNIQERYQTHHYCCLQGQG